MGNVTLLDDNKALVASGRERDAIIHRRCHLIEYPGCAIVKLTTVDNEIGLALAEGAQWRGPVCRPIQLRYPTQ